MKCARAAPFLLLVPSAAPVSAAGASPPPPGVIVENAPRGDALKRAKVWRRPAVPVGEADLQHNPGGPDGLPEDEVVCAFRQRQRRGLTPKLSCALQNGEVLKV